MKEHVLTLLFGILFLFFIQQISFLIESIYMLNLLNTRMDARALGILFFVSPISLLFMRAPRRVPALHIPMILFLTASAITPWVSTSARILSSGIAVGVFLVFLGMWFGNPKAKQIPWFCSMVTLALLSLCFRTIGLTQDSLISGPAPFLHAALTIITLILFIRFVSERTTTGKRVQLGQTGYQLFLATLGFSCCIALLYFVFISPAVVTRWTETSYPLIVSTYAISLTAVFAALLRFPSILRRLRKPQLVAWNSLFLICLLLSILSHTVRFPATPDSTPVVVMRRHSLDIYAMLTMVLAPVLFINLSVFSEKLQVAKPSQLALPFSLSFILFAFLIFALIFTNVWGYVGGFSLFFRNKFFLPFLLAGLGLLLPLTCLRDLRCKAMPMARKNVWILGAATVTLALILGAARLDQTRVALPQRGDELTVMTYNIQQGVDYLGNKNYENQLKLIRRVDPDIICLQESDTTRISGGNSDVVRYFAQSLHYHSYYGPKTVTGTFGTAILSRFPLHNCRTVFTYSDVDEVGTSVSEVNVDGRRVTIFNSHPAGSHDAKNAHIEALVQRVTNAEYVVAAGDYNFRQGSPYYGKLVYCLKDSWLSRWPDGVGDMRTAGIQRSQGDDQSAKGKWINEHLLRMDDRIDHIFLSQNFEVLNSVYLPVPASETDHPAHWAVIRFAQQPSASTCKASDRQVLR